MDPMKNRMSLKCARLLDDLNYGYWMVHMIIFIKSLGMEVWQSIMIGWSVPTKIENEKTVIKPES